MKAKAFMEAGNLVPDEVVIGVVKEALDKPEHASFLLDGFPRSRPQAEVCLQNGSFFSCKSGKYDFFFLVCRETHCKLRVFVK